jgi:hypothetical protein
LCDTLSVGVVEGVGVEGYKDLEKTRDFTVFRLHRWNCVRTDQ